jgi:hypothetical protein
MLQKRANSYDLKSLYIGSEKLKLHTVLGPNAVAHTVYKIKVQS